MCVPTYLKSGFTFPSLILSGVTPFETFKATWMLAISFSIAFVQKLVHVFWSIFYALSTVLGTLIPNLCFVLQYFYLTFEIIWSRLRRTYFTHHLKAGSSYMLFSTAYSSNSTGFKALRSFNGIQIKVPSFHSTYNFQPLVVFLACRFPASMAWVGNVRFGAGIYLFYLGCG